MSSDEILKNFESLCKKCQEEEEKYKDNAHVNEYDYTFPFIFLKDEEIQEFNEECQKSNIDLRVMPVAKYFDMSTDENENVDMEERIKNFIHNFKKHQNIPKLPEFEEKKKKLKKKYPKEEINLDESSFFSFDNIKKKKKKKSNQDDASYDKPRQNNILKNKKDKKIKQNLQTNIEMHFKRIIRHLLI